MKPCISISEKTTEERMQIFFDYHDLKEKIIRSEF